MTNLDIKDIGDEIIEFDNPSIGFKEDKLYYGILIPFSKATIKSQIKALKQNGAKASPMKLMQLIKSTRDAFMTSDGENIEIILEDDFIDNDFLVIRKLEKSNIPIPLIKAIIKNETDFTTLKECLDLLIQEAKKYIVFQHEEEYLLLASYCLGTYCFPIFDYFPILHFYAERGSGKTISALFLEKLGYNSFYTINMTKSALSRSLNNRKGCVIIDEKENINDNEELRLVLNGCFRKGGTEVLSEKIGDKWENLELDLYCPVVICSISPIFGATQERMIVINLKRSKTKTKAIEKLISKKAETIREQLAKSVLMNWKQIQEEYNRKGYSEEFTHLTNRTLDIWKPLLSILRCVSEDHFRKVAEYSKKQYIRQRVDAIFSDYTYLLLNILLKRGQNEEIRFSELFEDFKNRILKETSYAKVSMRLMSSLLTKIGYDHDRKIRKGDGMYLANDNDLNNDYLEVYYYESLEITTESPQETEEEKVVSLGDIFNKIPENEAISIQDLEKEFGDITFLLDQLKEKGEIYEPKPGYLGKI